MLRRRKMAVQASGAHWPNLRPVQYHSCCRSGRNSVRYLACRRPRYCRHRASRLLNFALRHSGHWNLQRMSCYRHYSNLTPNPANRRPKAARSPIRRHPLNLERHLHSGSLHSGSPRSARHLVILASRQRIRFARPPAIRLTDCHPVTAIERPANRLATRCSIHSANCFACQAYR